MTGTCNITTIPSSTNRRRAKITRINVIPVEELHRTHLQGEYKEATRIFGIARKAQYEFLRGKYPIPKEYTLGTGHCKFFVPRLKFIADRYEQLTQEMQRRGYKPKPIDRSELLAGINPKLYNDYVPTPEAIEINKQRINERMPKS